MHPIGDDATRSLPAEFTRASEGLPFFALPDRDGWAPESGFAAGMPAARDPAMKRSWLVHCYGALGVGRCELRVGVELAHPLGVGR